MADRSPNTPKNVVRSTLKALKHASVIAETKEEFCELSDDILDVAESISAKLDKDPDHDNWAERGLKLLRSVRDSICGPSPG